MHRIAVLALDSVVAFDLAVPAQVFGHDDERERYVLRVCGGEPGPVMSSTGFAIVAGYGPEALAWADTVIVPGVGDRIAVRPPAVLDALRASDARGGAVADAGDDDRVCPGEGLRTVRRDDREAGRAHHRAGLGAAHPQVVALALVVVPEHLRRDGEVERDDAVEREDGDPVHGWILA